MVPLLVFNLLQKMEEAGTMSNNFKEFSSNIELAKNLANDISSILQKSIDEKDRATLLLSGGNTPKLFLQELSKIEIDWEKVTVGLVDERWIDESLEDSNAYLLEKNLLINFAKKAKFVGLYIKDINLKEAQKECSNIYEKEFESIDVLVLGMGNDAHTASLFPNNERLKEAFDLTTESFCININPTTTPYSRMSLTLKSILSAKNIILHIEGVNKLEVYNSVLSSEDFYKYPIISVLKNQKSIEVYYS